MNSWKCRVRATEFVVVSFCMVMNGCHKAHEPEEARHAGQFTAASNNYARIDQMEGRLKHLEALAPGQGELMSQLGYNFSNLWFALDYENWPLSAFYLHECRETLEQAVDAEPVRVLSTGEELSIRGIADALDHTQFTDLEKAIAAANKSKAQSIYHDTMIVCYSCHQAAEMPFLRLRIPAAPPSATRLFEPSESN